MSLDDPYHIDRCPEDYDSDGTLTDAPREEPLVKASETIYKTLLALVIVLIYASKNGHLDPVFAQVNSSVTEVLDSPEK